MIIWALFFLYGTRITGSQPNGNFGTPENITVQVLDAKTVEVFWSSIWNNVERFDVTYNPTEDKIVSQAAGNSQSIVLRELRPDTQYQVTVTAVVGGKNYKSRRIVFRTSSDRTVKSDFHPVPTPEVPNAVKDPTMASVEYATVDPTAKYIPQTSSMVRGVELGLVLLALVVWIVAIALFFHRWGKIRMLLPYQPDYKTQQALKVPGTGTSMSANCSSNAGTQGQQDGPGCIQHMRWSSYCYDERSTAKKSKWTLRESPATIPPSSSTYFIRNSDDCECCESPEVITHAIPRKNVSTESIALCQLDNPRSETTPDKNIPVVTINVPSGRTKNEKKNDTEIAEKTCANEPDGADYAKLKDSNTVFSDKFKGKKYLNSLENISDSIQSMLGCTSVYNFCQNQKSSVQSRTKYEENGTKSEMEPLFFVGDKELYYNTDEQSETKIVMQRFSPPKHKDERRDNDDILPPQPRPKRYSRLSLKKQKVSLYDEKELDLYMRVPIPESKQQKKDNKQPENDKPESSRNTAEMKRKAFLRKISLQDTYLNYNQDYWLDFEKSVRFHKSIDLGYFGSDESRVAKSEPPMKKSGMGDKQKLKLTDRITEKSNELADDFESMNGMKQSLPKSKQSPVPLNTEICKRFSSYDNEIKKISISNSDSIEDGSYNNNKSLSSVVMADFRKPTMASSKKWFHLSSNENIPLFCERNGNIETDFDVLAEAEDEECLLMEKVDARREIRFAFEDRELEDGSSEYNSNSRTDSYDLKNKYDFSQFHEIKLNADANVEPVKRSNVFNFQGGQAFFGETRNSTSDESDVFYNETEVGGEASGRTGQGYSGRFFYVTGSENVRNSAMVFHQY